MTKKPGGLFSGLHAASFDPDKKEAADNNPVVSSKDLEAEKIEKLKSTTKRLAYGLTNYNISRLGIYKVLHASYPDDKYGGDVNKMVNDLVGQELDRLGIKLPGEE